jgi:PAS domain S-box-containing protein
VAYDSNLPREMPHAYDAEFERLRGILGGVSARLPHLRDELDALPVAVLIADDAGFFVEANHPATVLTGYSREELLQQSVGDITGVMDLPDSQRLWDAFVRTSHQHGVYSLRRRDGSFVAVEYCAYADVVPGLHISFMNPMPTL